MPTPRSFRDSCCEIALLLEGKGDDSWVMESTGLNELAMEDSVYKMVEDKLRMARMGMEEEWKLKEMNIKEEWKFAQARMEGNLTAARLKCEDQLQQVQTEIVAEVNRLEYVCSCKDCGAIKQLLLLGRILEEKSQKVDLRRMELRIMNKISLPILACEEIKGEGNTCIKVVLVDSFTGQPVDVEPEASASIEIVVLKKGTEAFDRDDWTAEEFKEMIFPEVEGKRPLLAGHARIKLQEGVGVLEDLKFRDHATKAMKPPEFRLGVRIVDTLDGILVKEAKSEPFVLKDYRQKYYRKHKLPSLFDRVSRLDNIRKGGMIEQRLQKKGIYTVEKFLIQLLKDHQGLKEIVELGGKKWDATVNHARKCQGDGRRYFYMNSHSGVVFDILGEVQGLFSEGHYDITKMLSANKKADAHKLFPSAIEHWHEIKLFADDDALRQHFAGTSGEHHNIVVSEEIGESSNNKHPNSPSDQVDMNSNINEADLQRSDSFNIHDVEILNGLEFMPSFDINPATVILDPDFDLESFAGECEMQWKVSMDDIFMEPAVAPMIKEIKRWKKMLSCMLFVRKMVAFKASKK